MCRLIATLTVCLAVTPFVHAQYGGQSSQSYAGSPAIPSSNGQIEKLPTPWVPPVPPVTPADYARTRSSQYALDLILMYSGYYYPYSDSTASANTYAGSSYGGYGSSTQPSSNTQNPYGQNSSKQNTYTPTSSSRGQPLATAA